MPPKGIVLPLNDRPVFASSRVVFREFSFNLWAAERESYPRLGGLSILFLLPVLHKHPTPVFGSRQGACHGTCNPQFFLDAPLRCLRVVLVCVQPVKR